MIVPDASVWISSVIPDEVQHQTSQRWLQQWTRAGGTLIGPVLFLVESAGAVVRRSGQPVMGYQAVAELRQFPVLQLVPLDRPLAEQAARLAADLRLRGADAVYVAVARHFSVPLVTWDQEQLDRAGSVIAVRTPD